MCLHVQQPVDLFKTKASCLQSKKPFLSCEDDATRMSRFHLDHQIEINSNGSFFCFPALRSSLCVMSNDLSSES